MSLEKEPAGAFNKAQRLIEYSSVYRDRVRFQQGPSQLNFTAIELDDIGSLRPTGSIVRKLVNLTSPPRSGDVALTGPFGEALLLHSGEVSGKILISFSKAPAQLADMQEPLSFSQPEGEEKILQVLVRDNNVEQALRVLKKKMQREGVFREMRRRRFYEKPSEEAARKKSDAIRRMRKLARKQAIRDGLIAAPPKKKRDDIKPPARTA